MTSDDLIALSVEQLSVNYDKTPVLWDVSFQVPRGKLVGIIGPNGAGKSTLLKSVLGMQVPIAGRVEFFGKPLQKVRHKVAYVPQRSSVDWDFPVTAFDVVLMGCFGQLGLLKWVGSEQKAAARRALEIVGMLSFADRQISQLSGGQQQRLFIARALMQEADLYFMDEPFAGVDMATEQAIVSLLDTLKQKGKTLFIVHHDLTSVTQYFDWVIMLNTCLIACGPVKDVFHEENIARTFGRGSVLISEAVKLSQNKTLGMR